ncbi:MAG: hypothetical protein ACXW0U_07800 [Halobacteriota archaeon]
MTVTYDVVIFSYFDRPIYNVSIGKTEIGAAGEYPFNGRATMTGIKLAIGPQLVSWELDGAADDPRTGEKGTAKNCPVVKPNSSQVRYMAVHIYPDETVELILSQTFPRISPRGEVFHATWETRNGQ